MRLSLVVLLAIWQIASATSCQQNNFEDQVSRLSCGDTKSITRCLMSGIDLATSSGIEHCFIAGGCETADAIVGAVWLDHECRLLGEDGRKELRKRADDEDTTSTNDDDSDTKTDAKATGKTATPASTEAKTTSESSASSESTPSTPSNTPSKSSAASSISALSASSSGATPTGTLECSTTKMVSTSVCSFMTDGPASGSKTCSATVTASARCAPGIICQSDAAGNPVCLKADNHLTTSGTIFALIFAIAIASFLIAVVVMCMRERKAFKRAEARRTQGLGTWKVDVEGVGDAGKAGSGRPPAKNLSEMNLPLISQTGTRGTGGRSAERTPVPSRGQTPVGGSRGEEVLGYERI